MINRDINNKVMEPHINNVSTTGKWKKELLNNNSKSKGDIDNGQVNSIRLDQKDYTYLMAWKSKRSSELRKQSTMFFYIGLTISLIIVITAFEWEFVDDVALTELQMKEAYFEELQDIPPTEQLPPPPPQKILQELTIVEVPDEEILDEIQVDLDVEVTEEMVVEDVEFVFEEPEEEKAEEIFLIVEEKPEPVGGIATFYKYVADNIKYPRKATQRNIQGRVFVQFVVDGKGAINDVKVIKGIGAGCDEEAIRILNNAPDWNAGKQRGKPVSVRMVLPITFKMAN